MTTKQSNWSAELSDFRDLLEPISPAAYNLGIELFNKYAPLNPSAATSLPIEGEGRGEGLLTLHYGSHFFFFWE